MRFFTPVKGLHLNRLLDVIGICRLLMQQSAAYLLFRKDYSFYNQTLILNEQFDTFQSLPRREFISLKNSEQTSRVIYIYNPTDQRRKEIKKILLDTHQIRVTDNQQSPVSCQIDPIWTDRRSNIIDINQFEVKHFLSISSIQSVFFIVADSGGYRSIFYPSIHNSFNHARTGMSSDKCRVYRSKAHLSPIIIVREDFHIEIHSNSLH